MEPANCNIDLIVYMPNLRVEKPMEQPAHFMTTPPNAKLRHMFLSIPGAWANHIANFTANAANQTSIVDAVTPSPFHFRIPFPSIFNAWQPVPVPSVVR